MTLRGNRPTAAPDLDDRSGVRPFSCVDVIIAARDRADTIGRAVLSALAQEGVRRVILVDDGSTDDTARLAQQCDPDGKRLVIERLPSSVGPSAARNIAIEISTAPWLAILDGDDFFLPGRVHALLERAEDCDFVADRWICILEGLACSEIRSPVPLETEIGRRLTFEQFVLGNVTRRGGHRRELGYVKPLMRRAFLDHHDLRYDAALRFGEDFALYARALVAGARFLLVPFAGYVAVERADSLSGRHNRRDLELLKDRDRELMVLSGLTQNDREAVCKHYADLDRRAQWLLVVEAVQSRHYAQLLSLFVGPPGRSLYLLRRLISEIPVQIHKRVGHLHDR